MFWFSSRIHKQRAIPVFRVGKRTYIEEGARPRKDRNPVPEAVGEEQPAFAYCAYVLIAVRFHKRFTSTREGFTKPSEKTINYPLHIHAFAESAGTFYFFLALSATRPIMALATTKKSPFPTLSTVQPQYLPVTAPEGCRVMRQPQRLISSSTPSSSLLEGWYKSVPFSSLLAFTVDCAKKLIDTSITTKVAAIIPFLLMKRPFFVYVCDTKTKHHS